MSSQDGLVLETRLFCQGDFHDSFQSGELCIVQAASELEGLCQLLEHHLNALQAAQQPLQMLQQTAEDTASDGKQQGLCHPRGEALRLSLCLETAITHEAYGAFEASFILDPF